MAQIICLANSTKLNDRCIAGIEWKSKKWLRPVYRDAPSSGISKEHRDIVGEPSLLDIIEIHVDDTGPDIGCQPENKTLLEGKWLKKGCVSIQDVMQYVQSTPTLLHSNVKRVDPDIFATLPKNEWKSLQLIHAKNATFYIDDYRKNTAKFVYNGVGYNLRITDPAFVEQKGDKRFSSDCLLTISMSPPCKMPCDSKPYCYKMVAGVLLI
jgi:hypothetical protein